MCLKQGIQEMHYKYWSKEVRTRNLFEDLRIIRTIILKCIIRKSFFSILSPAHHISHYGSQIPTILWLYKCSGRSVDQSPASLKQHIIYTQRFESYCFIPQVPLFFRNSISMFILHITSNKTVFGVTQSTSVHQI